MGLRGTTGVAEISSHSWKMALGCLKESENGRCEKKTSGLTDLCLCTLISYAKRQFEPKLDLGNENIANVAEDLKLQNKTGGTIS